jgi:hypothetical protein
MSAGRRLVADVAYLDGVAQRLCIPLSLELRKVKLP